MTTLVNPPPTELPDPPAAHRPEPPSAARIIGVATAVTDTAYTQQELLDIFRITDPKARSIFLNSAIEKRFISLPPRDADGACLPEEQGELLDKHKALDMGARAIEHCLANAGTDPADIDYLCVTTTTGFLTPGLSALRRSGGNCSSTPPPPASKRHSAHTWRLVTAPCARHHPRRSHDHR